MIQEHAINRVEKLLDSDYTLTRGDITAIISVLCTDEHSYNTFRGEAQERFVDNKK